MAKENKGRVPASDDQQSEDSKQLAEEGIIGQSKPEIVLIGLEAFASAKGLEWPLKVRLSHYAEQNKVTEKTFDEWEKILVQL